MILVIFEDNSSVFLEYSFALLVLFENISNLCQLNTILLVTVVIILY